VFIATPDHWHAEIAIEAMEAGQHVYIQKPMTRTLDEGIKVWKTAQRTNKIVQVGSQGCSDPKYIRARELLSGNILGKIVWGQASYCRNNPHGEWNYQIDPDATEQTVDWKTWLGKTKKRPWDPARFFRWRKYWDYGNGIIGDLWPHRLHPLMFAMNLNEFPTSVSCFGGDLCETDKILDPQGKPYGEKREVADTTMMMAQFPSGAMLFLAGATVNEYGIEDVIRGHKASMSLGGAKVVVRPERPFVEDVKIIDEVPENSGENHIKHERNFFEAIRTNKQPNCNIELAVRVQTVVSLAEMSYRKGKTMHFDPVKLKAKS
jgi:predicted dehydrogenase